MTNDPEVLELGGGAERIAAERLRQVSREGWSAGHDDEHDRGELAKAAMCYLHAGLAMIGSPYGQEAVRRYIERDGQDPEENAIYREMIADPIGSHFGRREDGGVNPIANGFFEWPWEPEWWKPSRDPIPNLVKAGALIAAEIDRLLRASAREDPDA